jgi:hypothetical protein
MTHDYKKAKADLQDTMVPDIGPGAMARACRFLNEHNRALEAALQAAIAAQNVAGWMPIESAPRDGTKCLFLTAEPEKGSPAYNMKDGRVFTGRFKTHGFCLEGAYTRNPTHWMPLPAAPDAGEVG